MTIRMIEYGDRSVATRSIADQLARDLAKALAGRETVVFLASGGRSPRGVLEALGEAALDWSRVVVSLSDERCAPQDHPHSNMRMVREAMSGGPAGLARTVPLSDTADADLPAAARRVSAELAGLMPFDVCLIGMGMDGHTASIFPEGEGMREARTDPGPFVATVPNPLPEEAPWPRITATLPALTQVRAQHLLLFGAEKIEAFQRLVESEPGLPIASLVAGSGNRLAVHACV